MLKITVKPPLKALPARTPYEYLRLQVLAKTILVFQRKAKHLDGTLVVFRAPYGTTFANPLKSVVADPQEDAALYLAQVWQACSDAASGFNFTSEQLDHVVYNLSAALPHQGYNE